MVTIVDNKVYDEAVKKLTEYLRDNVALSKNEYCNSDNWQFCIKHSLRVEKYTEKIRSSFDEFSDSDVYTLQAAAVLHDIGKVVQNEDHGRIGAEIVRSIFDNTEYISSCGIDKERLISIIANHSDKENENDRDLLSVILKDADVLDQVGAMSILMHATKHGYNSYDFYNEVLEDLISKELPYCEKEYLRLKTSTAKKIMNDKMKLVKSFIKQLTWEMVGDLRMLP